MTDTPVVLGGVAFQGFEVPNKLPFGGEQDYKVHDEIGNIRVVDAMGPRPGDKSWTGRFRGADAIARAQALDAMRIAGAAVDLSWFGLFYTVLITKFTAETEKFYEVPYSITVCVVDDPAQDGGSLAPASIDSLVGSDLGILQSIAAGSPADVAGAVSALAASVGSAGTLQGSTAAVIAPVLLSAQAATSTISNDIQANDPALDAASPDGQDPAIMSNWLGNMANAAVGQSGLADAFAYSARIALNLELANG